MLTKAQVTDLFKSKIHCSQIVLGEFAEELGYSREEAYKMANALVAAVSAEILVVRQLAQ